MHRFQRIVGSGDIVLEVVDLRQALLPQSAAFLVRPHIFDVDQKIGDPAFDPFQMAEAGVGSIELFHQLDDAIFEVAEGIGVAARVLQLLDLVEQRFH